MSASSRRHARRSRWRSCRPALSSRSRRSRTSRTALEDYVRSLELDAYVVGGAVRDELLGLESKDADFLVPGVDTQELKRLLEPHGRVEDLIVAGRLVGARAPARPCRAGAVAHPRAA